MTKYNADFHYDDYPIRTTKCIIPEKGIIKFDFEENGWKYSVDLKRQKKSKRYKGNYTARKSKKISIGEITAIRFKLNDDIWLIGTWVENGTKYSWWTKITDIEEK